MYVWFEAVVGYLSSTLEWSQINGKPEAWRNWWIDQGSKTFYFIGKDNIPFHAVIWPAELIGLGHGFDEAMGANNPKPLLLPYDVPANEFMNLEGKKISGSQNWAVWGDDFLERYDPDPLRYHLTTAMPENRDSDWDWEEFYQRNNNELVATWGNLVNRVLAFTYKNWEGIIPEPGELREQDTSLLDVIVNGFETVATKLEAVQLRAALAEVMALATEVNKYLDTSAPWFEIKKDRDQAAKSVYTALQAIDWLKIMFSPFLPHTSQKLHEFIGYEKPLFGVQTEEVRGDSLGQHKILFYDDSEALTGEAKDIWQPKELIAGKPFNQPSGLFVKLDHEIVKEERDRLGK